MIKVLYQTSAKDSWLIDLEEGMYHLGPYGIEWKVAKHSKVFVPWSRVWNIITPNGDIDLCGAKDEEAVK